MNARPIALATNSWMSATLGQVLPLTYGKAKTADGGYVRQGSLCYGSSGAFGVVDRALTTGPAIIVGRKGAAGAVSYSAEPCWPTDTTYFTEGTDQTHLPFFRYLLESLRLGQLDRSTAIPSLSRDDYNSLEVKFPTNIEEQIAVVEHIEEQFSRLDAGIAALKRAQANLKRYRASVLKAACEGRLVPTEAELLGLTDAELQTPNSKLETGAQLLTRILEERRRSWSGKGKYKEPASPDVANLPALPAGWTYATAEQLTDENRAATYGVIKLGVPVPGGVPVLRSSDVRHLRLDVSSVKHVAPSIAANYRRTFLRGGEILLTVRGTLGGVVAAPAACAGWNISREVAMLALMQPRMAQCLAIFIASQPLQSWLMRNTKGIAYTGINIETLKRLPIPLPPLAEEERIVAEVERRLSVADQLEATITANLARADRLRQAILQIAFSTSDQREQM